MPSQVASKAPICAVVGEKARLKLREIIVDRDEAKGDPVTLGERESFHGLVERFGLA